MAENIQNNPPAGNGGSNTAIVVIVVLILVALGIWWFVGRGGTPTPTNNQNGINVDVNLPGGNAGGTFPEGSGEQGGPAE